MDIVIYCDIVQHQDVRSRRPSEAEKKTLGWRDFLEATPNPSLDVIAHQKAAISARNAIINLLLFLTRKQRSRKTYLVNTKLLVRLPAICYYIVEEEIMGAAAKPIKSIPTISMC